MVLLISSFTMVMAVLSAQHGNKQESWSMFLVLTIVCACIFLCVKYFEYSHKFEEGLLPAQVSTTPTRRLRSGGSSHGYAPSSRSIS